MQGLASLATKRWLVRLAVFSAVFGVILAGFLTGRVFADTIVRGFKAQGSLQPGWVVALDKTSSDTVVASPAGDAARIYGVVIDPNQAPVTVQIQNHQVFVATSGTYPVLVSNQNGSIKPGDYISISSTDGIGAKAGSDQSYVLGQAVESFEGRNNVITTAGRSSIGRIEVTIIPTRNPLTKNDASVPGPLKRIGQAVAGKSVSAIRIYAALAIFVFVGIIAGFILWSGVRNGMIAIGRNPLSKHSIMTSLVQVIMVSILIFVVGLFGVYLLLKL